MAKKPLAKIKRAMSKISSPIDIRLAPSAGETVHGGPDFIARTRAEASTAAKSFIGRRNEQTWLP
jgi:hypothetical protein